MPFAALKVAPVHDWLVTRGRGEVSSTSRLRRIVPIRHGMGPAGGGFQPRSHPNLISVSSDVMTRSEYQHLVEFIVPGFDDVDRGVDQIDRRFDAVDQRFFATNQRFHRLEAHIAPSALQAWSLESELPGPGRGFHTPPPSPIFKG